MTEYYSDFNFFRLMFVTYFFEVQTQYDLLLIFDDFVAGDELPPY